MRMRDDEDDKKEDESRKIFQATGFHFYSFLPTFVFQLSLSLFPSFYFFSSSSSVLSLHLSPQLKNLKLLSNPFSSFFFLGKGRKSFLALIVAKHGLLK